MLTIAIYFAVCCLVWFGPFPTSHVVLFSAAIATVVLLARMFRPLEDTGGIVNVEPLFRLLWLGPIAGVWAVCFAILYFLK